MGLDHSGSQPFIYNIEISNYQMRTNFGIMTFFAVAEICREMNIRHPEEMSLLRSPMDKEGYVKLTGFHKKGRKVRYSLFECALQGFIRTKLSKEGGGAKMECY